MNDQTLHYQMIRSALLDEDDFTKAVGVARPELCLDEETPFAISFDLIVCEGTITPEPRCNVWIMQDGEAEPLEAHEHPWISERFGHAIFAFLAKTDFRDMVHEVLSKMGREIPSHIYTFALCADGLVLVAEEPFKIASIYGDGAVAALFRPTSQSNHQRLQGDANLIACAKAILSTPGQKISKLLQSEEKELDIVL